MFVQIRKDKSYIHVFTEVIANSLKNLSWLWAGIKSFTD